MAEVPDLAAPTIVITSPNDGAMVSGIVNVQVNATDNIGVRRVELYVDGALSASSSASPFTIKWNTRRIAAGAHTIQSRAYDAAGNIGTSVALNVFK